VLSGQLSQTIDIVEPQIIMADVEEDGLAIAVGTAEESTTKLTADVGIVSDDVFANGDDIVTPNSNYLHAGYGSTGEQQILPRKSSLIKDNGRGSRRKKTVSFSSMPGERTVVNGKCSVV